MVVEHRGAGYYLIFVRYANFSFLYALETFTPFSWNGINVWYYKKIWVIFLDGGWADIVVSYVFKFC
jgi:hypothetical protein